MSSLGLHCSLGLHGSFWFCWIGSIWVAKIEHHRDSLRLKSCSSWAEQIQKSVPKLKMSWDLSSHRIKGPSHSLRHQREVFCAFQNRTCTHELRNLSFNLACAVVSLKLPLKGPMKLMRLQFSNKSPSGEMHWFQVTLLPYSVFAVINSVSLTLLPCRTGPTVLGFRRSKIFLSESSPTSQALVTHIKQPLEPNRQNLAKFKAPFFPRLSRWIKARVFSLTCARPHRLWNWYSLNSRELSYWFQGKHENGDWVWTNPSYWPGSKK